MGNTLVCVSERDNVVPDLPHPRADTNAAARHHLETIAVDIPDPYGGILLLTELAGLSDVEIADRLGVSEEEVRALVVEARARFRTAFLHEMTSGVDESQEVGREEHPAVLDRLPEQVARLQVIVDAALDAIVTMDGQGIITGWNPRAERIFGWRAAEVIGKPVAEVIIPKALRESHRRGLERYLKTGEGPLLGTIVDSLKALHRRGHEFPVEMTIARAYRSAERLTFVAFIRDISDRVRNQSVQHAQFEVARTLAGAPTWADAAPGVLEAICTNLDCAAAGTWMVDQEAGLLRWQTIFSDDQNVAEVLGGASEELTFASGEGFPGRVLESGHSVSLRDLAKEPTFERRAAATSVGIHGWGAFPIRAGAQVIGMVELFQDAIGEAEAEVLQAMEAIGTFIGEFIERRRAEENIAHQNLELEHAHRFKSDLLANMTHELRTPLSAIIGYTDLLLEGHFGELGDSQRDHLALVTRSANQLRDIVDDVLDLAEIEAGRLTVDRMPFSLAQAVSRAVEHLHERAVEKGLEVDLELASTPIVKGDRQRTEDVVVKLLDNAIKFTAGGSIRVAVGTVAGNARVTVSDTGIGIETQRLDEMFESFRQIDSSATRAYGGLGLGLNLSRHLVEMQGGRLGAESQVGRGSTFWFELPLG